MTAKNDVTGDQIATGAATDEYRAGYDRIFKRYAAELEELRKRALDIEQRVIDAEVAAGIEPSSSVFDKLPPLVTDLSDDVGKAEA